LGPFESHSEFAINYDAFNSLLTFEGEIPNKIYDELEVKSHLSVISSTDEAFYFYVESIIVKSANSNTVLLCIHEAGLTELFEELSLDITADVDTWAANANSTDHSGGRHLRTFSLIDKLVGAEKTVKYGPLMLQGKYKLRGYMMIRVSISFSLLDGISATAVVTAGGTSDVLLGLSYSGKVTQAKNLRKNIWKPPPAKITFQPKIDVKGFVSVTLEASAEIKYESSGSVRGLAGYEDRWTSGGTASLTHKLTADVGAKASVAVDAGLVLTLSINLYELVGVDLNLDAGLKWGAEAELIRNPVLVEGAPYFLLYFTKFDVDTYAELPADGFFFG
jgi:hypothetical protein